MIKELLTNKTASEKSRIKSEELVKLSHTDYTSGAIDVEIISFEKITVNNQHGVEILARAYKNGDQLGFGNGSVDIERFRIFNPPIMVPDGTKHTVTNEFTGLEYEIDNFMEDGVEAIRQSLTHTIILVGKEETAIIKGKIGNTTSTFYPDPDTESTSVDGFTQRSGVSEAWATLIAGAGTFARDTDASFSYSLIAAAATTDEWRYILRSMFLFDTSAIGTDTISAATLSLFGTAKDDSLTITPTIDIYTSTPASNTALVASDHAQYGTTSQTGSPISYASWSTSAYNDFTLNATGISNISKTGVSKFAARNANYDVSGNAPTWSSGENSSQIEGYYADQTGTTNDPKLVVVHVAASTFTPKTIIF